MLKRKNTSEVMAAQRWLLTRCPSYAVVSLASAPCRRSLAEAALHCLVCWHRGSCSQQCAYVITTVGNTSRRFRVPKDASDLPFEFPRWAQAERRPHYVLYTPTQLEGAGNNDKAEVEAMLKILSMLLQCCQTAVAASADFVMLHLQSRP